MRALTWGDVDLASSVVRLQEHKTAGVTGDIRTIGLDPCIVRFFHNLRRNRGNPPAGQHVFLNGRGRPWKRCSFARILRKYAKIAGVPLGPSAYGLRHLFTITGIENGVGHRQIADQLGHASTKYVAWYGKQTRVHGEYLAGVAAQVLARKRKGGAR